jgi:hypothetical protein
MCLVYLNPLLLQVNSRCWTPSRSWPRPSPRARVEVPEWGAGENLVLRLGPRRRAPHQAQNLGQRKPQQEDVLRLGRDASDDHDPGPREARHPRQEGTHFLVRGTFDGRRGDPNLQPRRIPIAVLPADFGPRGSWLDMEPEEHPAGIFRDPARGTATRNSRARMIRLLLMTAFHGFRLVLPTVGGVPVDDCPAPSRWRPGLPGQDTSGPFRPKPPATSATSDSWPERPGSPAPA